MFFFGAIIGFFIGLVIGGTLSTKMELEDYNDWYDKDYKTTRRKSAPKTKAKKMPVVSKPKAKR